MGLEINADINFQEGQILLINKPLQWTSFDVVKKIKLLLIKKFNYKKLKVGHAGTLDPLATGLLIICIGKATKKILEFQILDKEYIAEIEIGKTTPSFDLETSIDKTYETKHITREYFEETIKKFVGDLEQVPPLFSAKNIDGQRAYTLARKGKNIELKPNKITIKELEIISFNLPYASLRIKCSKGTYIRALARDIGTSLKSGAHLTKLVRTSIGNFNIENSISIDEFEKKIISFATN